MVHYESLAFSKLKKRKEKREKEKKKKRKKKKKKKKKSNIFLGIYSHIYEGRYRA
jgi:hypothetical protein